MKSARIVVQGEIWRLYQVPYRHEGSEFCIDFYARSDEEAAEMLRSLRTTAVECQRIEMVIPAGPGMGWIPRLVCWFRNTFGV